MTQVFRWTFCQYGSIGNLSSDFGPLDSKCINCSRANESFPLKSSAHDSSRNRKYKSLMMTKRFEHNCKKKRQRTLVIATLLDWRKWPKLRESYKLITMPVMRKDHAVREGMCCGGVGGGVLRIKWSQQRNLIRHLLLSVDEQVVMIDEGLAAGNNSLVLAHIPAEPVHYQHNSRRQQ